MTNSDYSTSYAHSVYVVQAGHKGGVKIGLARNIKSRIEALQVSNPEEIILLAYCIFPSKYPAQDCETMLHRKHRKKGYYLRGEWYNYKILRRLRKSGLFTWTVDGEKAIKAACEHEYRRAENKEWAIKRREQREARERAEMRIVSSAMTKI